MFEPGRHPAVAAVFLLALLLYAALLLRPKLKGPPDPDPRAPAAAAARPSRRPQPPQ